MDAEDDMDGEEEEINVEAVRAEVASFFIQYGFSSQAFDSFLALAALITVFALGFSACNFISTHGSCTFWNEVASLSLEALLEKWPDYHGTAIYGAVARLNHACNPNCRVEFNGSADCRVIACRNVPEG